MPQLNPSMRDHGHKKPYAQSEGSVTNKRQVSEVSSITESVLVLLIIDNPI
jgi:hypothetical protein